MSSKKIKESKSGGYHHLISASIRDVISKGNIFEMQELLNSVKSYAMELESTIAKIENQGGHGGLRVPYGPPIEDATARGDLQEMKATAEAARRALYNIDYQSATIVNKEDIKKALEELEIAIQTLQSTKTR